MEETKANNEKKVEEHVYPEGGYGWVIVVAIVLLNASLTTLITCFGIIFNDEFQSKNQGAQTSFLLHLQSSLFCLIGFFGSPLLKKYNFRAVALLGATIWCTGILLTSFAETYTVLIFTTSILTGVGQGILMPSTYLAQNSYFKNRLTLAVSISTTGATLFSVVSPKICGVLVTKVGRKYTVLVLFCISLLSFVGCFLLKPVKTTKIVIQPEELTKFDTSQSNVNGDLNPVYKETTKPIKRESILSQIISIFDLELLRQIPYLVSVICLGVSYAAEINIVFTMQFVLPQLSNFKMDEVATIISVQFVFDILGRLVISMVCHYFDAPPKWVYSGALIAASFSRTLLATYTQSYTAAYVACCIIGATKGVRAVYQSIIIPKLVPLDKFVAANGFQMFFTGTISLAIGPIIGAIHDYFDSYIPALHTASVLSCACVFLWVVEAFFTKMKIRNTKRVEMNSVIK